MLFLAIAMTAIAQTPESVESKKFDFTDLTTEGKSFDGGIYVVGDKYYVAESVDSFFSALKIDPRKDVDHADVVSASNPYSKDKIDPVKKLLPEKYREFKSLMIFYLKK
jgi:hypothetical protein